MTALFMDFSSGMSPMCVTEEKIKFFEIFTINAYNVHQIIQKDDLQRRAVISN